MSYAMLHRMIVQNILLFQSELQITNNKKYIQFKKITHVVLKGKSTTRLNPHPHDSARPYSPTSLGLALF
jgi:hypothetical protein